MKNTFKLIFATFLVGLLVMACRDDADRNWTQPDADLHLYNTSLGSQTLYPTMKDNPFILGWKDGKNTIGEYKVVVASTEDFANAVTLGTSNTIQLKTTIGKLNQVLLQAGLNPYVQQRFYVRVESGQKQSNIITFNVKPYPVAGPIITNPTAGTAINLLDFGQEDIATTITWSDYAEYGVDVTYMVKIASSGSNDFKDLGSVTNTKSLDLITSTFNEIVLKAGGQAGVASDFDVKVTATTESTGGSITTESEIITISVTPYQSNVPLYLIGGATAAGWDNSATNANMYPLLGNHDNSTLYTFTGYFKAGGFKIIKNKGSWDTQYGLGDAEGLLSTDGGSGNIPIAADGYYKLSIDIAELTYTLEALSVSPSTYTTVGIIGDATPNGWGSDTALTHSTFDSHMWYATDVQLNAGQFKFRADAAWTVNWGSDEQMFGTAVQDGNNIIVEEAGTYDIYFNDYSGAFVLLKK